MMTLLAVVEALAHPWSSQQEELETHLV